MLYVKAPPQKEPDHVTITVEVFELNASVPEVLFIFQEVQFIVLAPSVTVLVSDPAD